MFLALLATFLCWGSFLNVLALRLLHNQSLIKRSSCPHCQQQLAWHHLIPLISWCILKGKCAFCKHLISWTYPAMELLTAGILTMLWYTASSISFPAYFIFCSALIITIRTDLEYLLILSATTVGMIPIGLIASYCNLLPISITQSILGAIIGFGMLWVTRTVFWHIRKQEGLGWGDVELLGAIGSFLGPSGTLTTLLAGSISGIIIAILLLVTKRAHRQLQIPFGALLAFAAIGYILGSHWILSL